MCGHDLRIQSRRRQRISWVDVLLVLAVLAVLVIWWRLGTRTPQEAPVAANGTTILPTNIPLLDETPTATSAPAPTPTATPPPPEQTLVTHEVQTGETLLSIALQYGVTVDEIQAANNLSSELIRAGDQLTIPVLRNPQPDAGASNSSGPISRFEYVVRPNDTIISIANAVGSSVDAILAANNLATNAIIRPGDRLVIPVSGVPEAVLESSATTPVDDAPTPVAPAIEENVIYIEPRLIGPPDGATLSHDETVLLRWVSVDVLQPNEWYVLLLYPSEGGQAIPTVWTKATSHRLDSASAPAEGQSTTYTWQVSVVRVRSSANGQATLEAASPPSALRRFTWQ